MSDFDFVEYLGMVLFGTIVAFVVWVIFLVVTAPDFIEYRLPDGRTVVCTNSVHESCDWENAR